MEASEQFTLEGGAGDLAARRWGPTGDARYLAILVHGYGEHIGRYDHVAERLVLEGAVVYGLDHRGHGLSDGERVLIDDFEPVVDDVGLLVAHAVRDYAGRPVVMIGHSMGGMIAARYAQRFGDQLGAVVLSGPAVGRMEVLHQLKELDEMPDVPIDTAVLSRDEAVQTDYANDDLVWHGPFKKPTVDAFVAMMDAINDGGSLGDLPTLWIHGSDDQLVPIDGTQPGIDVLQGTRFEQHVYPDARHEVFNEINREQVLDDVVEFISRRV